MLCLVLLGVGRLANYLSYLTLAPHDHDSLTLTLFFFGLSLGPSTSSHARATSLCVRDFSDFPVAQ